MKIESDQFYPEPRALPPGLLSIADFYPEGNSDKNIIIQNDQILQNKELLKKLLSQAEPSHHSLSEAGCVSPPSYEQVCKINQLQREIENQQLELLFDVMLSKRNDPKLSPAIRGRVDAITKFFNEYQRPLPDSLGPDGNLHSKWMNIVVFDMYLNLLLTSFQQNTSPKPTFSPLAPKDTHR